MGKGYNKKNLLRRIIEVQDEYMKHANSGRTTRYIYRTYIEPKFLISNATFYNYLRTPAKRDLLRIEQAEKEQMQVSKKQTEDAENKDKGQ